MKWEKKGFIYGPGPEMPWARHSAMTPTPHYRRHEGLIRVYASFRDEAGVGRIGWVDLDAENPAKVVRVCKAPALDVGEAGTFDDNGMILGDVIDAGGQLHLYYVGFQLVQKVKFLAFTGLAISDDGGDSFRRVSRAPIVDRSDRHLYFRALHSILWDGEKFRAWFGAGGAWSQIDGNAYPSYSVIAGVSSDGRHFDVDDTPLFDFVGEEYRIGRPRVWRSADGYRMLYTKGTLSGAYIPGLALSADGHTWTRADDRLGLAPSPTGWDSQQLAYPAPIAVENRIFVFYNGRNFGREGFGYAELHEGGLE